MKIKIMNWGPIETCEYDLDKSLIVTYGENNIGKSYAMQVVYLLLKQLRGYAENGFFPRRYFSEFDEQRDSIEDLVKEFVLEESLKVKDITEDIINYYTRSLEESLLDEFIVSLRNTFGTYDAILEQKPEIVVYLNEQVKFCFYVHENKIIADIKTKQILLRKTTSDFHKSRNNKEHYDIYVYENRIDTPVRLIQNKVYELQVELKRYIERFMRSVYFLPASRSGIYTGMSSFGPIMAQLSQNRAYFKGSFQIASIPEPVSDYYMALSSIKVGKNEYLEDVVNEIENSILNGSVEFDSKKKSLLYRGNNTGQAYEMNDVSSMVSEISPIVAYLKYIVKSGSVRGRQTGSRNRNAASIIFIEEPEAHLHPINQIKLMKCFTKLINLNIKLVLASHSNYIFNELNNRILAEELDKEIYSPILMKSEDGKSKTYYMDMDEFGVSDSNFADASDSLYNEREELVVKMMERWESQEE